MPERVEQSLEKFDPKDDQVAAPTTTYDRTLKEEKKQFDRERTEPARPAKPANKPGEQTRP